jgi:hypothetical protein
MPTNVLSSTAVSDSATKLAELLQRRTLGDPDYWSFRDVRGRSGSHGFFQYPAMMVPELQGALLDDAKKADPTISTVYDPFTGSGTVLVEASLRGLNFHGTDINPMAVLLAQVKATPPTLEEASDGLVQVRRLVDAPALQPSVRVFPYSEKWFHPAVNADLSLLRDAIVQLDSLTLRQYFWVCLAETVRLVSNSRISTFKLHAYTPEILSSRNPDAQKVFLQVFRANLDRLRQHWVRHAAVPASTGQFAIVLQGPVSGEWSAPRAPVDVLMTSPPYGDNKTTVPYGQHSYLALQWIDTDDIPGGFNPVLLSSTSMIDTMSLGGSVRDAESHLRSLTDASPALKDFLPRLEGRKPLRAKVLSFVQDYRQALTASSSRLRDGGFSFFTLGERRVGGQLFPLVEITQELLAAARHSEVALLTRTLPSGSKRMAQRNSEGATMGLEYILVTQKQSE